MTKLYFHFVDFDEPPSFRERQSVGFTYDVSDSTSCGWTQVDFGEGERHLIIFTASETSETASLELSTFLGQQRLRVVPTTLDWTTAQMLIHSLNLVIRTKHEMIAISGLAKSIDLAKMKGQITRKIAQNQKWNRNFENVMAKIKEYERKPDFELKLNILDECARLHVLPEE